LKDLQEEKSSIEEKERKTKKDQLRLRAIEEEMKPLEEFLAEAKLQRAAIKAEIGMIEILSNSRLTYVLDSMKDDPTKCVLVVDFTKFGMVDEGNVHCFVVSLLSSMSFVVVTPSSYLLCRSS
jgi:hypothetical protein